MMRFQHIEYLWLLWAVVLLSAVYFAAQISRKHKIRKIGDEALVLKLMPGYSAALNNIRFILVLLALVSGIIGLANLQSGARSEKIERKGIDVMIALDVSKSMLAKDAAPDRLEKSKRFIYKLLEKISNNRVGLILFAGKAYTSVPLTIDLSAFKMNLETATPDAVPTQGTVLAEAVNMARAAFNTKDTKYKSILLISDGEDHDEDALDAVKQAVQEGIMIHTVGVGSAEGSPIFDPETGSNKTDQEGQEVISKLNEKELQDIASAGQGNYLLLNNIESAAEQMARHINSAEQRSFGDSMFTDYDSYFQFFLGASLLFLIIEFFIPQRKKMIWAQG
ncbi:MAG: VWA domain-containing protein [Chitinophagaceae bacterium]|nr:VWA domain-containing protein [Chitinophagaceae bacterium]